MCSYFSVSLHFILSKNFDSLLSMDAISIINTLITEKKVLAIFCVLELMVVSFLILFTNGTKNIYHSKKVKLTDKLEIPTPIGDRTTSVHHGGCRKKNMTMYLTTIL